MLGVYEVNPTLASPFLQQSKPVRYIVVSSICIAEHELFWITLVAQLPLGIVSSIFMIMLIFLATPCKTD